MSARDFIKNSILNSDMYTTTDVGRIIGECRDTVAYGGGDGREYISRKLHAVTRVAGEPDDHLV